MGSVLLTIATLKRQKEQFRELRRAKRAKRQERARARSTKRESILDLIQRLSPHLRRPEHFRVYCERIEAAVGGGLRLVFAAPPQHGKTQCTLHGLVWLILNHPGKRHAYITYNQKRSRSVSKTLRRLLTAAGIAYSGTLDLIQLPNGGQLIFTSIGGGITGEPVDGVAIIDDPFKDRKEADSPARREVVLDVYREAIETRVHPGGSILCLATRWHPKDLSGTLINDDKWEYINLPAVAENDNDPNGRAIGEALFPEMWPADELAKKRTKVGEFSWAALYQGHPRPRGGAVFHEPTFFRKLPDTFRGAFGVDLAYTSKTTADWSVCITMLREQTPDPERPNYYVTNMVMKKVEAPDFTITLKSKHLKHPAWKMLWRPSGTEKGSAQFIQRQGIPLLTQNPPGDKFVAAQDVAAAWNDERVLLPDPAVFAGLPGFEDLDKHGDEPGWLWNLIDIVTSFTGNNKEVDDPVDALGNAFEALQATSMMELLLSS